MPIATEDPAPDLVLEDSGPPKWTLHGCAAEADGSLGLISTSYYVRFRAAQKAR
jgi:hypothetical protein